MMIRRVITILKDGIFHRMLPSHEKLLGLCEDVSTILEGEKNFYRPLAKNGRVGSLLDFTKDAGSSELPMVVVPDLHGRADFLLNIINFKLPKEFIGKSYTVFKALQKGLIRLVFVGDILHTEYYTLKRWLRAYKEFTHGDFTGPSMAHEMTESLSVWYVVFLLKKNFPEACHVLKGNHENILNVATGGDYSFRKYAYEGSMVRQFIHEYYGDDVLYMIHCVENYLPLVVVNDRCVVSHAEPKHGFSKDQIINARADADVVAGFTWTDNGEADEGSVKTVIKNLIGDKNPDDYVYIGGHRWVSSNYELRQNGLYIQIHNPSMQNIALVYTDKKFNPDEDIVGVE